MAEQIEKLLGELDHNESDRSVAADVLAVIKAETNLLKERKDHTRWIPKILLGSFGVGLVMCIFLIAFNFSHLSVDWSSPVIQYLIAISGCWVMYVGMDTLLKRIID